MFDKLVEENAILCMLTSIVWAVSSVFNIVAAILLSSYGHWIIGGLIFIMGVLGVTLYGISIYIGYKIDKNEESL